MVGSSFLSTIYSYGGQGLMTSEFVYQGVNTVKGTLLVGYSLMLVDKKLIGNHFFISVYRYSDVITVAKAALITRQKIIISVMSCVDEAQGNVT